MRACIDPCGMCVDLLRSHHVTLAEVASVQGYRAWLRWYPCAEGARTLPFMNAFMSPVWDSRGEKHSAPDVYMPSPDDARPRRYPRPPGTHWHGPEAWFRDGIPPEALQPGGIFVPNTICGVPSPVLSGGGSVSGHTGSVAAILRRGRGGIRVAGEGDERPALVRYATGGALSGGAGLDYPALTRETEGGALAGGISGHSGSGERLSSGGALSGGTAERVGEYVRTVGGGALSGGAGLDYPALTREAEGGGALAGGVIATEHGVYSTTCTRYLPLTLHGLFVSQEPLTCGDGLRLTLEWDGGEGAWIGEASACGYTTPVRFSDGTFNRYSIEWQFEEEFWTQEYAIPDCGPPLSVTFADMVTPFANPAGDGVIGLIVGEEPPHWDSHFVAFMRAGGDLPHGSADPTDYRSLLWGDV